MEWSIQDISRFAGTTSRTLRHYGEVGLLPPSRVGPNGYRYYDQDCLLRLQRILLLRDLGLGLPAIAEVLDGQQDTAAALRQHLTWLERERERLGRQIESVGRTLSKVEGGEPIMAEEAFAGFEHSQYEQEVTEKWGRDAWEKGDRWWRSLSADEQRAFQQEAVDVGSAYGQAFLAGRAADSDEVQEITRRHVRWLSTTMEVTKGYLVGLGQMYVDDPRYGKNYDQHGQGTVLLVRDAMAVYAERNL